MVLPKLVVGAVLMGIALINFINMLVVKTVSRKGEFAVYESLGMTRSQLRRLVVLEGCFHAGMMMVVIAPITALYGWFVVPGIVAAASSWCAVFTFSLAPLWAALPVILAIAVLTPLCCLRFVTKGSLNDRLRTAAR